MDRTKLDDKMKDKTIYHTIQKVKCQSRAADSPFIHPHEENQSDID